MRKKSDNWCPEIFRNVYIDRINDDRLKVAPCCQAQAEVEDVETFDFYTSPYLNSLRHQFSQGHKPKACDECWIVESVGHKSRRQSAIEFYSVEHNDQRVVFEGLDHSVTWACNLACIMCGPHNSSTWANELSMSRQQLIDVGKFFQKKNRFLEQIDTSTLRKIHFNGGEPLLNDDQILLLEKLDSQDLLDRVFVSYNTNASVLPSARLLQLWRKTRLVKIFFSIDGTDASFDYIRWPAKWKTVEQNMKEMKAMLPANVMFGINVTVGAYNIFEIRDVKNWFDQYLATNREGDPSDFNWQIAHNFDPKWLCRSAKQQAIDHIGDSLTEVANYLRACIDQRPSDSWIEKLDEIDLQRGSCWKDHLKVGNFY